MESASEDDLYAVLGLGGDADADALRAAYLSKIREHPPERDPEMFERVRDAYQTLSSPKRKMARFFRQDQFAMSMTEMVLKSGGPEGRSFLGTAAWGELLGHAERHFHDHRGNRP